MNKFDSIKTQDLDYNDREQALEILIRFKKKYLHDNLDELQNFSFWDILVDDDFNSEHDETKFDGDRTRIVYAIDSLLYCNKKLPNFCLGPKGNYSGDTICTFNTLFGSLPLRKYVTYLFNFSASELLQRDAFLRRYQTIGNFYILPDKTIKIGNKNESLNTFRGTKMGWHDYFDLFLDELRKYIHDESTLSTQNMEETFDSLLQVNKFYFSKSKRFDSFISDFYLEDYESIRFAKPNNYYHWNKTMFSDDIHKIDYRNFAIEYISKSTDFISNRSTKIIKILKDYYPELDKNNYRNK